jgi:hypothetical protein
VEPTQLYRGIDPDNGKKPDLEIRGLSERPILADFSLTEPICSSLTNNNSKIVRRSAKAAEAKKDHKYLLPSLQAGYDFCPLIAETYGGMGARAIKLFDAIIAHASEARGVRKDVLAIYWRRRLAVSLHKAIAQNILGKIGRHKAGPYRDESNYELVVQEQVYARRNGCD